MGIEIRPTHTCFDDMVEFLVWRVRAAPAIVDDDTLHLVHGIALTPDPASEESIRGVPDGRGAGEPFAHAWVEEDGIDGVMVWQSGLLDGRRVYFAIDRPQFVAALRVQTFTAYTIRDVWQQNQRARTTGPWEPAYQALTRTADAGAVVAPVDVHDAVVVRGAAAPPSFTCPRCGAVSFHPRDLAEQYCARCHVFTADDPIVRTATDDEQRAALTAAARRMVDGGYGHECSEWTDTGGRCQLCDRQVQR